MVDPSNHSFRPISLSAFIYDPLACGHNIFRAIAVSKQQTTLFFQQNVPPRSHLPVDSLSPEFDNRSEWHEGTIKLPG